MSLNVLAGNITTKQTERKAPLHWHTIRLGNVGSLVRGVSYEKDDVRDRPASGYVPILRATNIQDSRLVLSSDLVYVRQERISAAQRLQSGDIVIAMSSGSKTIVGKAAQLTGEWDGSFGAFCAVFRVDADQADGQFISYVFQSAMYRAHISTTARGTNINNLTREHVLDYGFLLPTLPEQRTIAHILRTVQEAIAARRREVELERERKAALMQHLFIYGTRGEPTKMTEIGEMPESWRVVRLAEVFEAQLGKMLSQKAHSGNSPKPYMRNANVQWGYVDCTDVLEMDFDEREREKFRLRFGDILVCEGGEVGRTALWRGELPECYFQKAIHRLRPRNKQMSPEFFMHHMERAFRIANLYGVAGTETTIAHLPQEKLLAMWIPLPTKHEQETIASALDACDACIRSVEREFSVMNELFGALLEELMTGRLSTLPVLKAEEGTVAETEVPA